MSGKAADSPDRREHEYDAALVYGGVANVGHSARARDFYRSTIFIAGTMWAEAKSKVWWVLSPANGVMWPNDWVAHHVRDLDAAGEEARLKWARVCARALDPRTRYAVIAPKNIREALESAGLQVVDPFSGRAGERVAAMFRDIDQSLTEGGDSDAETERQAVKDTNRRGQVSRGSRQPGPDSPGRASEAAI